MTEQLIKSIVIDRINKTAFSIKDNAGEIYYRAADIQAILDKVIPDEKEPKIKIKER